MTAAAIRKLIEDGKLAEDTKVLEFLQLELPAEANVDSRWRDITIGQLLAHRGGFDRNTAGDPMFQSAEIAAALGLQHAPSASDTVHYMLSRPLQFDPDSKIVYSNFGYCLLGRVIEKASGQSYVQYLKEKILEPIGIRDVMLGHTLTNDRDPREPFYADPLRASSVIDLAGTDPVKFPDGGFHLEAMDSHGGLIGTAPDLVKFLHHFRIDGRMVETSGADPGAFFGSLPGTFTVMARRPDGVLIAALFNQRADPSGLDYFLILNELNKAIDAIKQWPTASQ
jgi:N-acyl-D-amino-acid deacylase